MIMKYKYHYFYKITNNLNGDYYYGVHQTNNLNDRYFGGGTRLHYAYKKYGIHNFSKVILKFFDNEKDMYEYEHQIVTPELVANKHCYNLRVGGKGGQCGFKHSEEAKKKISKTSKGRRHSQEVIDKIQEHRAGYKHSEETRKKLSESLKGRHFSEDTKKKMKGRHHSDEARKKISDASKKMWLNRNRTPSEEARKRMSDAAKKRQRKPLSEETRKKISEKLKGNKNGVRYKNT